MTDPTSLRTTESDLLTLQEPGELLWLVCHDLKSLPKLTELLLSMSHQVMCREIDGLLVKIGFQHQDSTRPFVMTYWQDEPKTNLERRWVYTKLMKQLRSQFASHRYFIAFASKELAEQAYFTEDLLTVHSHPYYGLSDTLAIRVTTVGDNERESSSTDKLRKHYREEFRKWVNENPDELTSLEIGRRLEHFSKLHNCQFHQLDEVALKHEGLHLLRAVGQASEISPSRLFIVTANYSRDDSQKNALALVGKGITFDTGGINVKPFEGFVNCMRNDMGGAALMANLFMGLVKDGYKDPLVLAIPACENLVGSKSMKPGVMIKSRSGHLVQVEHTDAEGRLILADALAFLGDQYQTDLTLTAATLTTAALRQFTGYYTPVHFASEPQKALLAASAERYGEKFSFWDKFLPFSAANNGRFADLTNMGRLPKDANIGGGSNVAAHFLANFVQKRFIHLDIFASVWNWSGDYPGAEAGATGATFNPLWDSLRQGDFVSL